MDSIEETKKLKFHPGTKGTDAMNKRTPEEAKEHRQRVYDAVDEMVGKGYTYTEKFKELAQKFSVSELQAKNYIKWYHEDRKRLREELVIESREDAIAQYDYLYKEAMKAGNKKEARECLGEKVKLMGLAAPRRTESLNVNANMNTTQDIDISKFSLEELKLIQQAQNALQFALAGTKAQNLILLDNEEDSE
jgi:hypothetical protein